MPDDYSEFNEKVEPKQEAFKKLNDLVAAAKTLQNELSDLEIKTKLRTDQLNQLLWVGIPNCCDDMGLKEFTTQDGQKVAIKDEIQASITEERKQAALKWLDDNGHGGLVKRKIEVAFNKDQQKEAEDLLAELGGRFAGLSESKGVHPSTLKAFVREMVAKGEYLPLETFGVHKFRIAKF